MLKVIVLVLLFMFVVGFVYGEIVTGDKLTSDYLKKNVAMEIVSEGGCNGCEYDTVEDQLILAPGVKVKGACTEFCWAGELKLNGGTRVFDDKSELTGDASCAGAGKCGVTKGELKLKSGEVLNTRGIEDLYVDNGEVTGVCYEGCNFGGFLISVPKGGSDGVEFVYKNGVLDVEGSQTIYTTDVMSIKNLQLKKSTTLVLPDATKVKTDGIVKVDSAGRFILPPKTDLTISGGGKGLTGFVEDETGYIDIRNKAKCKKDSNCIKFGKDSLDLHGSGMIMNIPKDFKKKLKTFPKGDKEIITNYPSAVIKAKDVKGYPKVVPLGKKVKGYSMNGERLAYSLDEGVIQVCSIDDYITGAVVDSGIKCKEGKVVESGLIKIGNDINIGMPIKKDIGCKLDYIEMPDGIKPVDINNDGKIDYVLDVEREPCYGLAEYKKIKNKCKVENNVKIKVDVCIEDNFPKDLLKGKRYDKTPEINLLKEAVPPSEAPAKFSYYDKLLTEIKEKYDIPDNEKNMNRIVCMVGLRTKAELSKGTKATIYGDPLSLDRYCKIMGGKKFMIEGCYNQMVKICRSYRSINP